jgi:DnaK suppressor protein
MLNKKFIQAMKDNLISERDILTSQAFKEIGVDIDGDETDEIQGNMLLNLSAQMIIRNNFKIKKIDEALAKIEEDTYGVCEDCEDEIAERRLLANPYFTTCIFCAEIREKEEKEEKQRKRSSS